MKPKIKKILLIFILIFCYTIDRLTKYLIFNKLFDQGVYFLKNIGLEFQANFGIAFGLPLPTGLIIGITILLIIILAYFSIKFYQQNLNTSFLATGLIFIGASSNLLDRIINGFVIDFIKLGPWPNFNLADSYIFLGVLMLIFPKNKKSA